MKTKLIALPSLLLAIALVSPAAGAESAIYKVDKNFDLTLGYAYEKYSYSDAQLNGYNYTQITGGAANYLSGAYANPNYNANIFYVSLKYKLQ